MPADKKIDPYSRLRRTRLYIPGNNPAMIQNAMVFAADSIIFDLEDSIIIKEKDSARILVRKALENIDFGSCEQTVRINAIDTEFFEEDLQVIIPTALEGILLPKTETLEDIKKTANLISKIEKDHNIKIGTTKIMPIIETAKGVLNIESIAQGPRVVCIGLGGEDLTADIGAKRTKEGKELEYISSKIILACAANNIQAIDTVYSDINDTEGLYLATKKAIEIGFQGKSIIHPSQVEPVHRAFTPTDEEIRNAKRIIQAYKEAEEKGLGAITVDDRMIDVPVIKRSKKILKRAEASGTILSDIGD
ncbi:MAG: aldolase/citrate lyase family protein [Asgard group archaeon]|nr:aldolase/citrate lyase family protein [Asgard group archaeon]